MKRTGWLGNIVTSLALVWAACSGDGRGISSMTMAGAGAAGIGMLPAAGLGDQAGGGGAIAGMSGAPNAGRTAMNAGTGATPASARAPAASGGGAAAMGGATASAGSAAAVGGAGAASGMLAGTGGAGMAGGTAGSPAGGATGGCTPAPSGTFMSMTVTGAGPGGNYTIFRPVTLGQNGFKHPPVAWGNGLGTTPGQYSQWLTKVASNGFVVIANPGAGSDPQVVRQGLEWLIAQNSSGDYAGKLAEHCAGTIGYSMGGGAAVGSGSHADVRAVVSVHGLSDASENVKGPLLLTTSDDDSFVPIERFVQPCYDRSSKQPTIMATYVTGNAPSFSGHLTPLGDGKQDAEPTIAWLRYWLYGDQSQRDWFFGASCKLCVKPWGNIQRKNYMWD